MAPYKTGEDLVGGAAGLAGAPTERSVAALEERPLVLRASSPLAPVSHFFASAANMRGGGDYLVQEMGKGRAFTTQMSQPDQHQETVGWDIDLCGPEIARPFVVLPTATQNRE